jgi:transcription antitermination protein NusB
MSARSKARKRALDILYETDLRGTDPLATVGERIARADPPVPEYAVELVEGVTEHRARIDEIIASYAEDWTMERMPPIDRNILRIGVHEMLWRADIPDVVAIDEAIELAKSLSTDDSPRFINGVLARILRSRPVVT